MIDESGAARAARGAPEKSRRPETEPFATIFSVVAAMVSTFHEPVFKPIEFQADQEARTGHFSVSGIAEAKVEPSETPSPERNIAPGSCCRMASNTSKPSLPAARRNPPAPSRTTGRSRRRSLHAAHAGRTRHPLRLAPCPAAARASADARRRVVAGASRRYACWPGSISFCRQQMDGMAAMTGGMMDMPAADSTPRMAGQRCAPTAADACRGEGGIRAASADCGRDDRRDDAAERVADHPPVRGIGAAGARSARSAAGPAGLRPDYLATGACSPVACGGGADAAARRRPASPTMAATSTLLAGGIFVAAGLTNSRRWKTVA